MSCDNHNDNRFWFGFFFGGLIGAIVLFFLGTKEGKKAGRLIKDQGEDIIDTIQDRLNELKIRGKELADEGEALKAEVIDKVGQEKEKLTDDAKEKIDTVLAHIEEMQERGRQATATIRKEFKNVPKKS